MPRKNKTFLVYRRPGHFGARKMFSTSGKMPLINSEYMSEYCADNSNKTLLSAFHLRNSEAK